MAMAIALVRAPEGSRKQFLKDLYTCELTRLKDPSERLLKELMTMRMRLGTEGLAQKHELLIKANDFLDQAKSIAKEATASFPECFPKKASRKAKRIAV